MTDEKVAQPAVDDSSRRTSSATKVQPPAAKRVSNGSSDESDNGRQRAHLESAIPADKDMEALTDKYDSKDDWATDPENPRNWPLKRKWRSACVVSLYTLFSPLTSSMMAPGLLNIAQKYSITNPTVIALTLCIFLLTFAIGPLIFAPLSEMWGRTWLLHIGNIGVIAFNLGCAFSPNVETLIVMRLLCGFFASSPIAIGGGSMADLFDERDRAAAMGVYILGPLLGPVFGPVAGGFITQGIGIKYVFIILSAVCGLVSIFGIPMLQETYAPVIRAKRAKKEGRFEEFIKAHPEFAYVQGNVAHLLWVNISRPTVLLFKSMTLFILSLYMAVLYGIYYLMFTTFSQLFTTVYGFKPGVGGLVYLGLGVGFFFATVGSASVGNKLYLKLGEKNGGVRKPEYRLPGLIVGSFLIPIGLLWYGWSAQTHQHYIMPIVGIFGFAMMTTFMPINLYIVDSFTFAASATAAASVFRSLLGFAFPLFASQMFEALDYGPGNSLLAGLAIVLGIPFPIFLWYKGESIRAGNKYTR